MVKLTKNGPGPAAVRITGNEASSHFGVRALPTDTHLVNTENPYHGVRSLDWDRGESTGCYVRAAGTWTIRVLPLSAVPTFDKSFSGEGDLVVRFVGDGTSAHITGNQDGGYFHVRAYRAGKAHHLVNTTRPYAGSCRISNGPQYFEIQATGPWTITIK